ncbi:Ig-like domain-containing protein [Vibrio campbellii]|uniref:Ig-like domain-containing protein n=1 Tax=Vibrio campbellii TaxID=680 RepID=UPI0018C8A71C|nr:Ig-like domain-containing protein [Vibrio campbellii]
MFSKKKLASVVVRIVTMTFMFLYLSGCNSENAFSKPENNDPIVNKIESIQILPNGVAELGELSTNIPQGFEQRYIAIATYTNGDTKDITRSANWLSSDTEVAINKSNGVFLGASVGQVMITAEKAGVVSNKQLLTVNDAVVVSIQVTPPEASFPNGGQVQLSATATLSNGDSIDVSDKVVWISSSTEVVEISDVGLATGLKEGLSNVSASFGDVKSNSVNIAITSATVVQLHISPQNASVPAGVTQQYRVTALYSDKTSMDVTKQAIWTVSNEQIASNSPVQKGLITTKQKGKVKVTAHFNGTASVSELNVTEAVLEYIQVTPSNSNITVGLSESFTATGVYSDGTTKELGIDSGVSWSSDDTETATVSPDGKVTGQNAGNVVVTVKKDGVVGKVSIAILAAEVERLQLLPSVAAVPKGLTQQYSVVAVFNNDTTSIVTNEVAWDSDSRYATVDASGKAVGVEVSNGPVTITATLNGIQATGELTVNDATIENLRIVPPTASIPKGQQQQFDAIATYSDGSSKNVSKNVFWSSSSVGVTVSKEGLASGNESDISPVTVTAMLDGQEATSQLTVTDAVLTSIQVTPVDEMIPVGQSKQFTATGIYSDGTSLDITNRVSWLSSDLNIASVDAGLVSGIASSNNPVQITAVLGGTQSNVKVTVTDAVLVNLQVTPALASIPLGINQQYAAKGIFSDGTDATLTQKVSWITSDETAVTINTEGVATGVRISDSVKVKASLYGIQGEAQLSVTDAVLEQLQLTPKTSSIPEGLTEQYKVIGVYSNSITQDLTGLVTWKSSDESKVTIDEKGLAFGEQSSSEPVTVIASIGDIQASALLTVTEARLDAIQVTPAEETIPKGRVQQYKAIGFYSDGSTKDLTKVVSWQSEQTSYVTLSQEGVATAVSASGGFVNVVATSNGIEGSAKLTVTDAVLDTLETAPKTASIAAGLTEKFMAIGTFSDGSRKDLTNQVSWVSADIQSATVSDLGVATGVRPSGGSFLVTATLEGKQASSQLTITNAVIEEVVLTPKTAVIPSGRTQQYQLTGRYSDGNESTITTGVSWSSSDTAKATITPGGLATGAVPGVVSITAEFEGFKDSGELTITQAVLEEISIFPESVQLNKGGSQQLKVTGTFSDGSTREITDGISWSSPNTSVVTVSDSGIVTGVSAGEPVAVVAILDDLQATSQVTVSEENSLVSVKISPQTSIVYLGRDTQFKLMGVYSNGEEKEIVEDVIWTSSSANLSIDQNGVAKGKREGDATIIARFDKFTASLTVGVWEDSVETFSIFPQSPTLKLGQSIQAKARVTYFSGYEEDVTNEVTWGLQSTDAQGVISINSSGLITGIKVGREGVRAYTFNLYDKIYEDSTTVNVIE